MIIEHIKEILNYAMKLKFEEKPNYVYIISCLRKTLEIFSSDDSDNE